MIIQIRGTSGSGKSTVMRHIMDLMGEWNSVEIPKRRKPLYYLSASDWPSTAVLGHYESPCGGCDTIGSAAKVAEWIQTLSDAPNGPVHILCEGLLLSEDVKWTSLMPNVRCVFLTTDLDRCLRQIEGRREAAGNEKPLDPKNTTNRVRTIDRARVKLIEAGVTCRRASPEQAPKIVLDWLRRI